MSLSLYILAASNRDNLLSAEAGVKYFVLGALASGIFLFGCSLVYGFSGTADFAKLATFYSHHVGPLPVGALLGIILILVALFFKMSAAPFHMWAPDVYQGAPTVVTAFFASAPKVAVLIPYAAAQWIGCTMESNYDCSGGCFDGSGRDCSPSPNQYQASACL